MELLTIGAFARAAGLTPKALRLYARLGLLVPAAVDPESGYRYYAPGQLHRARLINKQKKKKKTKTKNETDTRVGDKPVVPNRCS